MLNCCQKSNHTLPNDRLTAHFAYPKIAFGNFFYPHTVNQKAKRYEISGEKKFVELKLCEVLITEDM
jgi:hypothetical protein